jgi:hypothetical protein
VNKCVYNLLNPKKDISSVLYCGCLSDCSSESGREDCGDSFSGNSSGSDVIETKIRYTRGLLQLLDLESDFVVIRISSENQMFLIL